MAMIFTRTAVSLLCGVLLAAAAGFVAFWHPGFLRAQIENPVWKNFSEQKYGLSLQYPGNSSFNVGYDRYAAGLINVDIVGKNCSNTASECAAACADIRIFIGSQPSGNSSQLFIQLYEDMLGVKDTNNPELVQKLNIGGKAVYKVLNEAPTLSLNGACGGPLYVFDAGNGYFAYIFAGYGAEAATAGEETVQKIISSLNVGKTE